MKTLKTIIVGEEYREYNSKFSSLCALRYALCAFIILIFLPFAQGQANNQENTNISLNIPASAEPGSAFVVEVIINKGNNERIGKFQQELPSGFTVTPIETEKGKFKFKDQKVEIIWIKLPPENKFSISYNVTVGNNVAGEKIFRSKFQYLENKQCKSLIATNNISIEAPAFVASLPHNPLPGTLDEITSPKSGCAPHTIWFINELYKGTGSTIYTWDFGDGVTSNQENPKHTYYEEGTYLASLTATEPGGYNAVVEMQLINVYPVPTPEFMVNPEFVFLIDEPAQCLNLSKKADSYQWDFGDETTSDKKEPQHYYALPGEYTITLIAANQYGCSDTVAKEVIAKTGGLVFVPKSFTPESLKNNILVPLTSGIISFNMKIFDKKGKLLFETNNEDKGWNGLYKGKLCKQGVHKWKIAAEYMGGEKYRGTGTVILWRHKSNMSEKKKIHRPNDLIVPAAKYNLKNNYPLLNSK
ncbi:MAG: PKD domain-containing protein [Cytophagales bacterium]|nr:PKD domain-containing protein [Cytophagales bacterium]